MQKQYELELEVSGSFAIWRDISSGIYATSYPAPTYSAIKGIFESILFVPEAEVVPCKVEVCSPLRFTKYVTSYCGPSRKQSILAKNNSELIYSVVLCDVCYKLYALATNKPNIGRNAAHCYQDMFQDFLKKGKHRRVPCLGWSDFIVNYFGPFRNKTKPYPFSQKIHLMHHSLDYKKKINKCVEAEIKDGVLEYECLG